MLIRREIQAKYAGYRLGYLWTLLEPLGMILVMWLVFSALLGPRGLGQTPYILFLALGILPWWWFTRSLAQSTKAITKRRAEIKASVLPRQTWVLQSVSVGAAEFVMSLPILILIMVVNWDFPNAWILLFPVGIVLEFVLILGFAFAFATWCVRIPDLGRTVRIILRALFYLSPVLFTIERVPASIRPFAELNPIVGIFGMYRAGFWDAEVLPWHAYVAAVVVTLVIFLAGYAVFARNERRVLKLV